MKKVLILFTGLFLFVFGCSDPNSHSDAEKSPTIEKIKTSPAHGNNAVTIAEFEAIANPATGELTITMLRTPQGNLTTRRQNLTSGNWSAVEIPESSDGVPYSGDPETAEVYTVPDTINIDGECGANPLYEINGAFCATVDVSWFGAQLLPNVYAEITLLIPAVGHTALDDAPTPGMEDGPQSTLGLFFYGDIAPNGTSRVKWVFERFSDEQFYLKGSLKALMIEICGDGIDNNQNDESEEGCPVCGDGQVDFDEPCDDGNIDNTDGCRDDCTIVNCDNFPAMTVDGDPGDWAPHTKLGDGDNNVEFYLTRDDTYFYVAFKGINLDDNNAYIAFDSNPEASPEGVADAYGSLAFPGDQKPETAIVFTDAGNIFMSTDTEGSWSNGSDVSSWSNYKGTGEDPFSELRIPLDELGDLDPAAGFSVWMWADNNDETWLWSIWPNTNPTSSESDQIHDATAAHFAQISCPACGDGIVDEGEECDDNNNEPQDGCSPGCTVEHFNDGNIDPGEECDDGNDIPGDGCADGQIDLCGNDEIDPGEECDGSRQNSYECDENCNLSLCGNGLPNPPEECDDGNEEGGDGCSTSCKLEENHPENIVSDCLAIDECGWFGPDGLFGDSMDDCWDDSENNPDWDERSECLDAALEGCDEEAANYCLCEEDPECTHEPMGEEEEPFTKGSHLGTGFDEGENGLTVSSGTIDANYLWVPNTAESTMSKWNAHTATEEGRYRVGFSDKSCIGSCCWNNGCNMPSRVVIDARGDAYVANRGFATQGSVTKVASMEEFCVDRNENNVIETSTDATPLDYGADECVLWNTAVGVNNAVLRGLAIDLGDDVHPEGYAWAGGYESFKWYKLNPNDGSTMVTVDVPVRAYGGIVTSDGKLWIGTLSEGGTAYIDTNNNTASAKINYPISWRGNCTSSYGITADSQGRVWFAGWDCRDALGYDPSTEKWTRVDTTPQGVNSGRGITIDSTGKIWMALGGDGAGNISYWDSNLFTPDGTIPWSAVTVTPMPSGHTGASGVGADAEGYIWVAHHVSSQLVRIDPENMTMDSFTGANRIYTYSDFTGAVRRTVIGRGSYYENFLADCETPNYSHLSWDVSSPEGTTVTILMRTASTAEGLDDAPPITLATIPSDESPLDPRLILEAEEITPEAHSRVSVSLVANEDGHSPIVYGVDFGWYCPLD